MIEESYVSFDTARMLKEAGFDVPCRGIYRTNRTGNSVFHEYDRKNTKNDLCWDSSDGFQYEYLAPTQALAARWLREKHGIHVSSDICMDYEYDADGKIVDAWTFWNYYLFDSSGSIIEVADNSYDSYEEALEAGLQEAIKLIKKECI